MQLYPTIRKQPASSVRYGESISTRGGYVWCAYDGERLVAVAATAKEVHALYRRLRHGNYGRAALPLPSELDGRRDKPMSLSEAERTKDKGL